MLREEKNRSSRCQQPRLKFDISVTSRLSHSQHRLAVIAHRKAERRKFYISRQIAAFQQSTLRSMCKARNL